MILFRRYILSILLGLIFVSFFSVFPVTFGSDLIPSREGPASFPNDESDNEMNGFAAFENGFVLED